MPNLKSLGILAVACLPFLFGCASKSDRLRRWVNLNRYADAAKIALDDSSKAAELSALILENAALLPDSMDRALERLSVSGTLGRASLKRLSKGNGVSARAARIAYERFRKPSGDELAACVKDPHPSVRRWCALAWSRYMSEEMQAAQLLDMDPDVRLYALRALAALPFDPKRAPLFSDALRLDPEIKVRIEAAVHGDRLGEIALILLKTQLRDPNLGLRTAAISGIARIHTEAAVAFITSIAEGPLDQVTLRAQAELAGIGYANGKRLLLGSIDDEKASVRAAALYLLPIAKVESPSTILAKSLKDKAPEVVLAAAGLLRTDKDAQSEVLLSLRKISKLNVKESPQADVLLAEMGDERAAYRAAVSLKKAVSESEKHADQGKATENVILALRRVSGIADAQVRQVVVSLLGDRRKAVRIEAAHTVLFSMSKI